MLRFASLAWTVVLAGGLGADDKPPAPPTPKEPTLSRATARVEGDTLQYQVVIQRMVPQQRAFTVNENGQLVTKTVTVQVPVHHIEARNAPLKDLELHVVGDAGSDPTKGLSRLDPSKLDERLRKSAGIVTTADVKKIAPAELKALKPGTIVLVLPKSKPVPPPPPPVPPAKKE